MSVNDPATAPSEAPSPWSLLRNPLFRSLWIATIVSNVGTWMQDVGRMADDLAVIVAIDSGAGPAADSLPVMLLALPAGAIADIVDRRRLLVAVQVYLLAVAGLLGVLTALDLVTMGMLLGFIFALGVGTAVVMPAWAAIVPELVPAEQLQPAVVLNSIAINVSRAVGPAIAGVLVAATGAWLVFVLNALSYIGIVAVLLQWRRVHRKSTLPAERFLDAIRVGLRFIMHARPLQVVLVRGIGFFLFASATWSLFPLIVRRSSDAARWSMALGVV